MRDGTLKVGPCSLCGEARLSWKKERSSAKGARANIFLEGHDNMATKHNRYEDTVTIACINFQTSWGDKAANLAKMKEIVGRAAQQGCNIIVFPELALSGYECDSP